MPKQESVMTVNENPKPVAKTFTNWDALAKAGLVPLQVDCQAYRPVHLADFSCHTRLKIDSETLRTHMQAEHGGAYELYLKRADGKESPLWKGLTESGLEAGDVRCGVCSKQVRLRPQELLQHMRPHAGDTKQRYREVASVKPGVVGLLRITLQNEVPLASEETDEFGE